VPVRVSDAWREEVRARLIELPHPRFVRYVRDYGLGAKEAFTLVEEREVCLFYERVTDDLVTLGVPRGRAGKIAANVLLQSGQRRANEQGVLMHKLGATPAEVAAIGVLKEHGKIGNQAVEGLFEACCVRGREAQQEGLEGVVARVTALATERGWLIQRDDAAMERWIGEVLTANPKVAEDVRGGKVQAVGRLVGEVMKLAGGAADAKTVRDEILKKLQA
jgi:aspartyl-tRNA(Asn)/glutamyl-tRNA(Gln) amidotransferase subunit B